MNYITFGNEAGAVLSELGGKAASLYCLSDSGIKIPPWFVISARAFEVSLSAEEKKLWSDGSYCLLQEKIPKMKIDDLVLKEIQQGLSVIPASLYAVRSSASDEDSDDRSFAGQYETYLNVQVEKVEEAVRLCWMSAFSERVADYRSKLDAADRVVIPSVIIQQMLVPESAGVAFAIDPVALDFHTVVISAVHGLGDSLVNGDSDADTYHVIDGKKIQYKHIADEKEGGDGLQNDSNCVELEVSYCKSIKPVLNNSQILEIADLARKVSSYFGKYQDVEWAFQDDQLYLLQSRAITSLKKRILRNERSHVFDNSNASENYYGITLPLTYSFARRSCELAMRTSTEMTGTSKNWLMENVNSFRTLYGYVDGQLLMGLKSWYRILETMPGSANHNQHMEMMMGLDENQTLNSSPKNKKVHSEKWKDFKHLLIILKRYTEWKKLVDKYYQEMESDLLESDYTYSSLSELADSHTQILEKLGRASYVEVLNDTLTMVFDGTLRKKCIKWFGNEDFRNQILVNQKNIISVEPVLLIKKMSDIVRKKTEWTELFLTGSVSEIEDMIEEKSELKEYIQEYLKKFGDRCVDELKFESRTLHDDPLLLYRNIGQYAEKEEKENRDISYKQVLKQIKPAFSRKPASWAVFRFLSRKTREHVAYRENFRFQRTRMFAAERRIFREIGIRFASMQILENRDDIYYLEVDEIIRFMNGTASTYELNKLVQIRKDEYTVYMDRPEISHVTFYGSVGGTAAVYAEDPPEKENANTDHTLLTGQACCSGRVTGTARVVLNPLTDSFEEGEILIAKHTDPGWILVIGRAAGVVIENGSLLSHAAIVTREMGIPSVVSVKDAVKKIKSGDRICIDGSEGTIEILNVFCSDEA